MENYLIRWCRSITKIEKNLLKRGTLLFLEKFCKRRERSEGEKKIDREKLALITEAAATRNNRFIRINKACIELSFKIPGRQGDDQ